MTSYKPMSSVLERFHSLMQDLDRVHALLQNAELPSQALTLNLDDIEFSITKAPVHVNKRVRFQSSRTAFKAAKLLIKRWVALNLSAVLTAEIEFELQPALYLAGTGDIRTSLDTAFGPLLPLLERVPQLQYALLICMQVAQMSLPQMQNSDSIQVGLTSDAVRRTISLIRLTAQEIDQTHQDLVWQQLFAYCGYRSNEEIVLIDSGETAIITSAKLRGASTGKLHLFVTVSLMNPDGESLDEKAFEVHSFQEFNSLFAQSALPPMLERSPLLLNSLEMFVD